MPYTSPAAVVSGAVISKTTFGDVVKGDLDFLANPPACRVYHNAAQAIASGVTTYLAFNSERFDTNTMHDTVTNNSRITINTAGLYVVNASVEWAAAASNDRRTHLQVNRTTIIGYEFESNGIAGPGVGQNVTALWKFAQGDYVEVMVVQTSGASINVNASSGYSCEFSACWIGLG